MVDGPHCRTQDFQRGVVIYNPTPFPPYIDLNPTRLHLIPKPYQSPPPRCGSTRRPLDIFCSAVRGYWEI